MPKAYYFFGFTNLKADTKLEEMAAIRDRLMDTQALARCIGADTVGAGEVPINSDRILRFWMHARAPWIAAAAPDKNIERCILDFHDIFEYKLPSSIEHFISVDGGYPNI